MQKGKSFTDIQNIRVDHPQLDEIIAETIEFKVNRGVCLDVGKIIHDAVEDQAKRGTLVNDAKSILTKAGITDKRDIRVVEDTEKEYYVVVPKEVKSEAFFGGDRSKFEDYLVQLGTVVICGCK
jgi:hypothetical protein